MRMRVREGGGGVEGAWGEVEVGDAQRDREEGEVQVHCGTCLISSHCGFLLAVVTSKSRSDRAKTVDVEKI